jgi:hypothetical protein
VTFGNMLQSWASSDCSRRASTIVLLRESRIEVFGYLPETEITYEISTYI